MDKQDPRFSLFAEILKRELQPAMGCTEPIALAYCAANARKALGALPERALIELSGNIIKNVKSVIVPNTDGQKGIETAVAIGFLGGDANKELEVLSRVTQEQKDQLSAYKAGTAFTVRQADNDLLLDIHIWAWAGEHCAEVRLANSHANIIYIRRDDEVLLDRPITTVHTGNELDYSSLTVEGIFDYAQSAEISDVKDTLDRQIQFNSAIAQEGLANSYGANIGKVLMATDGQNIRTRARAMAAAGSDARMSGCDKPVVINSGSGNQGLTVSLPLITYAEALRVPDEKLYRALILSNLTAVHLKHGIGCLSAYCGAVSAGAAAGAGIAYLHGGGLREVVHTIVNALAVTSGIICDGAKASCAAKISTAVDAGILGYEMFIHGQQFVGGDGLVSKGVENTIRNVASLGRDGMRQTDREILRIMTCVD